MASIHVDIVSAEGHIHRGEAAMVFAPAEEGEVGIAPRHAPLLTRLKPGGVRVKLADGSQLAFFVTGGILEVQPDRVTVLADSALHANQANEADALKAKQAAEDKLSGAQGTIDYARVEAEWIQASALVEFLNKIKHIR